MVLCEDLDEWDGRDAKTEGTNADVPLIHFIVQQKLTQQCKATIPPIKKKSLTDTENWLQVGRW